MSKNAYKCQLSGLQKNLGEHLRDLAFDAVREAGAVYPAVAHNSSGDPTIVDTDNGDCYVVEVKIRKIE